MANVSYPRSKLSLDVREYYINGSMDRVGHGNDSDLEHFVEKRGTVDCTGLVFHGASPSNWQQVIANGGSATSPLSGYRRTCEMEPASWSYHWEPFEYPNMYYGFGDGPLFANFMASVSVPSDDAEPIADQMAREKFLSSYLEKRGSWRGANFVAEIGDTIHMLRHPISTLFNSTVEFADRVRRIRNLWRHARHAYAQRLGELWLSYSFGWKPLFEDIKDVNNALESLTNKHDSIIVHGYGKNESCSFTPNIPIAAPVGFAGRSWICERKDISRSEVKYYGALIARPNIAEAIADNFGFNPQDIIPAIWEAIPWSFFVDYFVNVQEVLDSYHYVDANFGWINVGVRNTNVRSIGGLQPTGPNPDVGIHNQISGGSATAASIAVKRGSSSVPYPGFRFKIPGLDSTKWYNIAALHAAISRSRP